MLTALEHVQRAARKDRSNSAHVGDPQQLRARSIIIMRHERRDDHVPTLSEKDGSHLCRGVRPFHRGEVAHQDDRSTSWRLRDRGRIHPLPAA